jgi:hypothetical protein
MDILPIALFVLWFCSVYVFAQWRFQYCANKGVVLETIMHDLPTKLYLRCTAGFGLALIVYIL